MRAASLDLYVTASQTQSEHKVSKIINNMDSSKIRHKSRSRLRTDRRSITKNIDLDHN